MGSDITIEGNGSTIERSASSQNFRLFTVFSRDRDGFDYEGQLTLNDLTIQNGNTQYNGGAIYVLGELNIENTTISSNTSSNAASGQGGGAIFVRGSDNTFTNLNSTITVSNSTISGNTALNGGGILAETDTTTTIENSTVSGNSASDGGGIFVRSSFVSLNNSTVSGNSAISGGGGIYARDSGTSVTLSNSTVSGNSATFNGDGIDARSSSDVTLNNSTVSGNSATGSGGGIYAFFNSTVTLNNSIIANSLNGDDCKIGFGGATITADNHNIIEDGSCGTNALSVDPLLGPLQDNGGATYTHALFANSPAINAGDSVACRASPINRLDQRGFQRVGVCEIGSFEFNSPGPPVPPPPPPFNPATIVPPIMLLLYEE